jgi:hypothetical protein
VLKPTGSVDLHCHWHASQYLKVNKVKMDEVFVGGELQNEVI